MNSITELMDRDPLLLKKDEIGAIIEHYRKNRTTFNIAAKKAPTAAGAKKIQAAQEKLASLGVKEDDLDLDL